MVSSSRRRRKAKMRGARKLKHGLLHLWPAAIRLTLPSQWITIDDDIALTYALLTCPAQLMWTDLIRDVPHYNIFFLRFN